MRNGTEHAAGGGTVALVGNPNVGKSTLFNALTHLRQHTGNWPGKTVDRAQGTYTYRGAVYTLMDLPGTYSLQADSPEEEVTRSYLLGGEADAALVVTDATCLERSLKLVLQVLEQTPSVVVCVNLMDEARKKRILVDLKKLEMLLGCPVVGTAARGQEGLETLRSAVAAAVETSDACPMRSACLVCGGEDECCASALAERARMIAQQCVAMPHHANERDRRIDRVLTSRAGGGVLLSLLLVGILWLTIAGASLPSRLLSDALGALIPLLHRGMASLGAPWWLSGALVDGMYRTVAWVISVMLPPMAIFFPLFTILEDAGLLPRVAFDLDGLFARSGAHGRQALTMCMGLGCNACGVAGCRIIRSERERLMAILTNSFMPCNGRFPALIAVISLFLVSGEGVLGSLAAAAILAGCIGLSVGLTFGVNRLLSYTVLRGQPSSCSLELPPYRFPRVGQVLVRSILDRTLYTLSRALSVAAPAGLVIWIAANVSMGEESLLLTLAGILDLPGRAMGMDGVLLLAFVMGFPAGEIVLPCALMGYLATGMLTDYESLSALQGVLVANGWTATTALCVIFFMLYHFPCAATCMTIWRETRSVKWTAIAIVLPTVIGAVLCMLVKGISVLL